MIKKNQIIFLASILSLKSLSSQISTITTSKEYFSGESIDKATGQKYWTNAIVKEKTTLENKKLQYKEIELTAFLDDWSNSRTKTITKEFSNVKK